MIVSPKQMLTNSLSIPNWIVILIFIFTLSGYGMFYYETTQHRKTQREILEGQLEKLVPIREEIDSLTREKQITLRDIEATQKKLEKLKSKLNSDNVDEINLEEALEIIGRE